MIEPATFGFILTRMGIRRLLLGLLPTRTNRHRRAALRFARTTLSPEQRVLLEETPGCLSAEQGAVLYTLAAYPPTTGTVVEIGSFLGRSTCWLAAGVRHAGRGRVVSIDPHAGHERPPVHLQEQDTSAALARHVRQAGLSEWVEFVRRPSGQAAEKWHEPIDLLWIDGSHTYEDVLSDLNNFARYVVEEGHIALHDTRGGRFPGVRRAMRQFFTAHPQFRRILNLRNMAVYRRQSPP